MSDYLKFINPQILPDFKSFKFFTHSEANLEYSLDGSTWTKYTSGETIICVGVIFLRGYDNTVISGSAGHGFYFQTNSSMLTLDLNLKCEGDIRSLFNYKDINSVTEIGDYACYRLFEEEQMVNIPKMNGITSIGKYGCYKMFANNVYLKEEVDLSNLQTVDISGCESMFSGDICLPSVTNFDNLSTLFQDACNNMFSNCIALKKPPVFKDLTLMGARTCKEMFKNCHNFIITEEKTDKSEFFFHYSTPEDTPFRPVGVFFPETLSDCCEDMFKGTRGGISTPEFDKKYYYGSCRAVLKSQEPNVLDDDVGVIGTTWSGSLKKVESIDTKRSETTIFYRTIYAFLPSNSGIYNFRDSLTSDFSEVTRSEFAGYVKHVMTIHLVLHFFFLDENYNVIRESDWATTREGVGTDSIPVQDKWKEEAYYNSYQIFFNPKYTKTTDEIPITMGYTQSPTVSGLVHDNGQYKVIKQAFIKTYANERYIVIKGYALAIMSPNSTPSALGSNVEWPQLYNSGEEICIDPLNYGGSSEERNFFSYVYKIGFLYKTITAKMNTRKAPYNGIIISPTLLNGIKIEIPDKTGKISTSVSFGYDGSKNAYSLGDTYFRYSGKFVDNNYKHDVFTDTTSVIFPVTPSYSNWGKTNWHLSNLVSVVEAFETILKNNNANPSVLDPITPIQRYKPKNTIITTDQTNMYFPFAD